MNGILEGIRVLDFGRWIAGPYCAHILASLGADVVRVERPKGEDDRYLMPVTRHGEGAQFLQCNDGKRSLSLRMTSPEGREVMRRMIAQADVVVANYSPSGLRHFGLDYDTLRAIRPDIILASASAYGTDGPMAERIGFDGVGQAVSGAIHLTGEPGQPFRAATAPIDFATALSLAYGTLAAIIGRMRTGEGAHVEGSLVGTSLNITNQILMEEATGFRHREPTGNRSPMSGPSDVFRARDGWFIMQVIGQKVFERWCRLIGREDLLEDPRFASDDLRGENGEELSRIMRDWAAGRSRDECIEILGGANIGCGPVLAPAEVVGGALDLRATFMRDVPFPGSDPVPIVPPPARLSRGGVEMSRPPLLGEHSDAVLASHGFGRGEIDRLRGAETV
ncbi:CaiB/BaiF CoA transferase family protein [Amaricoccus sp. W119]|uniref:CaiB/BaiF CoA transferase family protein n=1 Tax=Amaricoccus sp. W119 TaxID=3391833 RepID=UPI0039A46C7D